MYIAIIVKYIQNWRFFNCSSNKQRMLYCRRIHSLIQILSQIRIVLLCINCIKFNTTQKRKIHGYTMYNVLSMSDTTISYIIMLASYQYWDDYSRVFLIFTHHFLFAGERYDCSFPKC